MDLRGFFPEQQRVRRVEAQGMSGAQFRRECDATCEPVVLQGAMQDWPPGEAPAALVMQARTLYTAGHYTWFVVARHKVHRWTAP